jgi:hypothetical protein
MANSIITRGRTAETLLSEFAIRSFLFEPVDNTGLLGNLYIKAIFLLALLLLAFCMSSSPFARMAGGGLFYWSPMSPSPLTCNAFSKSTTVGDFRKLSRQLTPGPSPQAWLASSKRRVGILDPPASPLEMLSPVSRPSTIRELEAVWLIDFSNRSRNHLMRLNGTRGCPF